VLEEKLKGESAGAFRPPNGRNGQVPFGRVGVLPKIRDSHKGGLIGRVFRGSDSKSHPAAGAAGFLRGELIHCRTPPTKSDDDGSPGGFRGHRGRPSAFLVYCGWFGRFRGGDCFPGVLGRFGGGPVERCGVVRLAGWRGRRVGRWCGVFCCSGQAAWNLK